MEFVRQGKKIGKPAGGETLRQRRGNKRSSGQEQQDQTNIESAVEVSSNAYAHPRVMGPSK
jgi:hypothetical protein